MEIKKQKGFTLIEVLVSISVFSMVMTGILDLYMMTSKNQRKMAFMVQVQNDTRTVLRTISDRIKLSTVNYGYYGDDLIADQPVPVLALIAQGSEEVIFTKCSAEEGSLCGAEVCFDTNNSSPCVGMRIDNGDWEPLTSKDIKADRLDFYIRPTADPFKFEDGVYLSNTQPNVTVALGLRNVSVAPGLENLLLSQTTVTSRIYKR